MRKLTSVAVVIAVVLACFIFAGPVCAEDSAALVKQVNASLRDAQNHLFSGRIAQAGESLAGAESAVAALKSAGPGNAQLPSLEQKCAKLRKDIESRSQKTAPSAAPAAAAPSAGSTTAKLPAGALFRLKEANRSLDEADRVLRGGSSAQFKNDSARASIKEAQDKLSEITSMFGAQISTDAPEIKAVNDRIATIEQQLAGVQAGAAQASAQKEQAKAAAEEWTRKIEPYVMGPGRAEHNPDKYLTPSSTSDPKELVHRQNLCREAIALLDEYSKAGLTDISDELAEAQRQLQYAVQTFQASYKEHVERCLQDAERSAGEIDSFLKRQESAAAQAIPLEKSQLGQLRQKIDAAEGVAEPGNARVTALRSQFSALEKRDAALRQAHIEQTRMTPDRYAGGDLSQLKQRAERIVTEKTPGAKVLRTTVISADWKEESVIEPTDTTHTALRFRTTRSVTAQVAAKQGDKVLLHTLDLSKDLQADGSWGSVYGHIMFSDPMIEKNVE